LSTARQRATTVHPVEPHPGRGNSDLAINDAVPKPSLSLHEVQRKSAELRRRGLLFYGEPTTAYLPHSRVKVDGHGEMLMFGSYSYLSLNGHPDINRAAQAAIEHYGTGTLGVRLLAGTLDLHRSLEARVARFMRTEAAVTFSSGFLANVSTIACLVGRNDTVICDKLNHASIVDGCRMSRAKLVRFGHNDMGHLRECLRDAKPAGRKLVIVDAVFSMDGDIVNLPEVSRLCREYGAMLMVDEAHSIGVLGATGHGIEEHFGLAADSVDVKMGTFSKAIPSCGAYVASSKAICDFLRYMARGFIYTAAMPPAAAAAAAAALDVIEREPGRVKHLRENVRTFAACLCDAGFPFARHETPIFPINCGRDGLARELARYFHHHGIYVQAITQPVVPAGSARLRVGITSDHRVEDMRRFASVLRAGALELGILKS